MLLAYFVFSKAFWYSCSPARPDFWAAVLAMCPAVRQARSIHSLYESFGTVYPFYFATFLNIRDLLESLV